MFISAILIGATALASVSAISLVSSKESTKPINNTVNNITNNVNNHYRDNRVDNRIYNNTDNRTNNSFSFAKEEIDKDALINDIKDIFREQDMKARMKEFDDRINKCK